jgi:ABC-type antimicrobial peptide transport system permease subunit
MVAIGLVVGVPLAIGSGRLIASQLYGVSTLDPLALGGALAALGLCAFAASIVPALRASRIDPMIALRSE